MNFTKATPVTHPEETSLGRPERALMRSLCEAELDESRRPGAVIRTDCTSWGQYAEGKTLKSLILHLPLHMELSIQLHPVTLATSKNLRLRRTKSSLALTALAYKGLAVKVLWPFPAHLDHRFLRNIRQRKDLAYSSGPHHQDLMSDDLRWS